MPDNKPTVPPIAAEPEPKSTRTLTFRAYREQMGLPAGARLTAGAEGKSVWLADAAGNPLSEQATAAQVYALVEAFRQGKLVRVVL